MPLNHTVKQEVIRNIERYEGRVNHLYLDSLGKVTIGIGHLIPNKAATSSITMYKSSLNGLSNIANIQDKQVEYENIVKQPRGYPASWYKRHTTLVMKDSDVNALRDKHLESFYLELACIYKKKNGYPEDFD